MTRSTSSPDSARASSMAVAIAREVGRSLQQTEKAVVLIAEALSPKISSTDEAAVRRDVAAYVRQVASRRRASKAKRRTVVATGKPLSWRYAFVHGLGDLIDFFPATTKDERHGHRSLRRAAP